jgi:creatinine amidohydrolase
VSAGAPPTPDTAGAVSLAELTRERLRELAPRSTVVLPIGSVEQHGPHLPLVTDLALVEHVTAAAAARAGERVPVLLAPALPFGSAHHHRFAAALSLAADTLIRVLGDLLESLALAGCRRVLIVNGHGGNSDAMRIAGRRAVLEAGLAVATCDYWAVAAEELAELSADVPGHAGDFETSLMLAIAPNLVDEARRPTAAVEPRALFAASPAAGIDADAPGEWARIDGYTDPSNKASAERGAAMLDTIVERLADAIAAFHAAGRAQNGGRGS